MGASRCGGGTVSQGSLCGVHGVKQPWARARAILSWAQHPLEGSHNVQELLLSP